jgi:hypothetical protein
MAAKDTSYCLERYKADVEAAVAVVATEVVVVVAVDVIAAVVVIAVDEELMPFKLAATEPTSGPIVDDNAEADDEDAEVDDVAVRLMRAHPPTTICSTGFS